MRKRMITIGCLLTVVGVWAVLNSKMNSERLGEKASDLSLYQSIHSTKKTGEKGLSDQIKMKQASVKDFTSVEILSKDIQKLAQELRVDEDETYRLKELNNFRTPLKDIVGRVDPKGYARFLEQTIKKIHSCLGVDFCGMQKDRPDSAYFDEQNTIAHKTLLRSLSAMEMLIDQGHSDLVLGQIDAGILERLLENDNAEVQKKAMRLLKNKLNAPEAFSTIMKNEKFFSGEGKAYFYEELATGFSNEGQRQVYLDSLASTLASDDPHTVLSIVEKIPRFSIEKEQLTRVAQGLCRFQSEPGQKHNWLSIDHKIKKLKKADKIERNFDCL